MTVWAVLSLQILVASDFDKVAGEAIYYIQYYYMSFLRIIGRVAWGSNGSNLRYCRPPMLVDNARMGYDISITITFI